MFLPLKQSKTHLMSEPRHIFLSWHLRNIVWHVWSKDAYILSFSIFISKHRHLHPSTAGQTPLLLNAGIQLALAIAKGVRVEVFLTGLKQTGRRDSPCCLATSKEENWIFKINEWKTSDFIGGLIWGDGGAAGNWSKKKKKKKVVVYHEYILSTH